jgi:hypothetical protein
VGLGKSNGIIDRGMCGCLQKQELMEAKRKNIGDDWSRLFGRNPREQELQSELLSQAAVEQFRNERTIRAAQ